jgi:hypothetical protein
MVDTEVKNRKVNRSKGKNEKNKEIPNPAVDPRDEVRCHSVLFNTFNFNEMQLL